MSEKLYWLGFSVFPGVGPIRFSALYKRFGSAKNTWNAKISDVEKCIGENLSHKFDKFRNKFSLTNYIKALEKKGVSFLTLNDKDYPKLLAKIDRAPFVLYTRGDKKALNDKCIAVVGTRKITQYGEEATRILTGDLARAGFSIVSGLAFGVDAIAHKTALDEGQKTIAVLGCGVDCCTPPSNQALYNSIVKNGGCIVSEYPLSQLPTKGSFPARNRIIAGLSEGVLVTEGTEDSGALITAEWGLKFSRKVFAVPGPITSSLSKGPYKLISKGAKLVTSANDILKELNINKEILPSSRLRRAKGDTKEENLILKVLENEALQFDQIIKATKLESSQLGSILSMMEIKGLIKNSGDKYNISSL